ncbi:MAG: sigma-70 family RNA polymerase sigma factor [Planctomycetales bacterium]
MNPDVEQLIAAAREGDAEALGRLLQQYRPYLKIMAQRRLDPALAVREDASDVVQRTCLEAHRDLVAFHGNTEGELVAWLKAILNNNALEVIEKHRRAGKRNVDRRVSMDDSGGGGGQPLRQRLANNQSSPSQRAMRGEAAVRLAQFLDQLPEDQREAVRLRHLEGWSLAEIADHFQRSRTAVAGLLKRGLRAMRREFAQVEESE